MPEKVRPNLNICLFWGVKTTSPSQPSRDAALSFILQKGDNRGWSKQRTGSMSLWYVPSNNQLNMTIKNLHSIYQWMIISAWDLEWLFTIGYVFEWHLMVKDAVKQYQHDWACNTNQLLTVSGEVEHCGISRLKHNIHLLQTILAHQIFTYTVIMDMQLLRTRGQVNWRNRDHGGSGKTH